MTRQVEQDKPTRRVADNSRDCAYEANGLRCKYPGAISHGTTGGGPWYCRVHAREMGSRFAQQALQQSQVYRPQLPPEDDLSALSWLAANFPMHPGETRQAYNMRCKAFSLSMLKGFRPKSVVNTEPVGAGLGPRMREPGEDLVEL